MESKSVSVKSYREVLIGGTIYRVTSVYLGQKDLGTTLEEIAVRRAMAEIMESAEEYCGRK